MGGACRGRSQGIPKWSGFLSPFQPSAPAPDQPFRASTNPGGAGVGRTAERIAQTPRALVTTASSATARGGRTRCALHALGRREAGPGGWARTPEERGGAARRPCWGGVGCHPCAHLGRGAGSEPLRRRDLRGPRVEQEVSQGREPRVRPFLSSASGGLRRRPSLRGPPTGTRRCGEWGRTPKGSRGALPPLRPVPSTPDSRPRAP